MTLHRIQVLQPLQLSPLTSELWQATHKAQCAFHTDEGVYLSTVLPGFVTDLRSGCCLINPFVPKWGNAEYTWDVVSHDIAYHGYLSFELANDLYLRQGMHISQQISKRRAAFSASMVDSFGRSHYSDMADELPEPYTHNRPLCKIELVDRLP